MCLRHKLNGLILSATNLHDLAILKYLLQLKLFREQSLQFAVDNNL